MNNAFRLGIIIFILFCLTANALGTLLLFEMRNRDDVGLVLYGAGSGFMFGQVVLLTIWGVLGPEALSRQLPRSIGLCIFVFYSWVGGTIMAKEPPPTDVSFVLAIFATFLFLILAFPMWIVRQLLDLRIYGLDRVKQCGDQFTIRQIMIWTAAIAVLTAVGKVFLAASSDTEGMPPASVVWTLVFMISVLGVFVAGLGLPLVWGVLAPRVSKTVWRAVTAVFLTGPAVLHECIYILQRRSPSAHDRFVGIVAWYGFYLLMAIVICSALWVVRIHGYRFGNPNEQEAQSDLELRGS